MTDDDISLMLAELFFLDTEVDEIHFIRMAEILKSTGWTKEKTYETLLREIAPVAGANLGFGFYPVIGEWAGFDREDYLAKIQAYKSRNYPPGLGAKLMLWHNRRFLKNLGVDKLLEML